jgi:hypothetical protein
MDMNVVAPNAKILHGALYTKLRVSGKKAKRLSLCFSHVWTPSL